MLINDLRDYLVNWSAVSGIVAASIETNLKWQKKSGMVYFQIGLSVLEYAVIFYRNYNPNNDYVEQFLSKTLSIPIDTFFCTSARAFFVSS